MRRDVGRPARAHAQTGTNMAKTKQQKQAILARLMDALKKDRSSALVHFKGVSVAEESAMRKSLREQGLAYFVAKKTLIKKALAEQGFNAPTLDGEVAVIYNTASTDTTAPARLAHGFAKTLGAERFSLLAGIFEERLQDKVGITEIATIPSVDVLRGMFANVLNSPLQRFAIALSEVAKIK